MTSSSTFARHTFKAPPCESYCLSILKQQGERPLMAASFTDQTTKIWDLDKILVQKNGDLEKPDLVIKNSVELAPVQVQLAGRKLATSSIDGSLKLYDINISSDSSDYNISATNLVDPTKNEFSAEAQMMIDEVGGVQGGIDGQNNLSEDPSAAVNPDEMFYQNSTHSFAINPLNSDQIVSGWLPMQILEYQTTKKGFKVVHEISGTSSTAPVNEKSAQKFINCMDWSPNGKFIACGDIDGQAFLYEIAATPAEEAAASNQCYKSSLRASLLNHGKGLKCLKFSPDTSMLITGGEDLHLNMVDVNTQQRVLTLVNHADWITSIAFNPADPKYFASSSLDGTVKIWKQGDNQEVKTIAFAGNGGVWKVDFTQDGKYIGVCCQDGTIGLISFVN